MEPSNSDKPKIIFFDSTGTILKPAPVKIEKAFLGKLKEMLGYFSEESGKKDNQSIMQYTVRRGHLIGCIEAYLSVYIRNGYFITEKMVEYKIREFISVIMSESIAGRVEDAHVIPSNLDEARADIRAEMVNNSVLSNQELADAHQLNVYEKTGEFVRMWSKVAKNRTIYLYTQGKDKVILSWKITYTFIEQVCYSIAELISRMMHNVVEYYSAKPVVA